MENDLVVRSSVSIDAPASRVWNALVNPEITKKYMFNCEAISGWKIGDSLAWRSASDGIVYVKGTILKVEPEKLLQYTTFDPNGGLNDVPSNYLTVTCNLSSEENRTTLSVSQGDFATAENGQERFEETVGGWNRVLAKIKEVVEGDLPGVKA